MPTNYKDEIILTPVQVHELASASDEPISFEEITEHVRARTPTKKKKRIPFYVLRKGKAMLMIFCVGSANAGDIHWIAQVSGDKFYVSVIRSKLTCSLGKLIQSPSTI